MEETKKEFEGEEREENWKETVLTRLKPYILCIFGSFSFAGFNIISKVCLDKGMNKYVLAAYGNIFGTATIAVFALIFKRNSESKRSLPICINIFFLGLLGVVGRIFLYAGLECTSSTFAAAMNNLIPSVTFILSILCRMEKFNLFKLSGQAKVGGTVLALGGATLMTLYKGITVVSVHPPHKYHQAKSKDFLDGNLIKGSLFFLLQNFSAASFYVLQASTIKRYPALLTLNTLSALSGSLTGTVIASILDHRASSWRLSWDITLVAPIYSGIMIFGIATYVQTLVIRMNGPVFLSAFRPLTAVIVAIMGLLILGETLHLGGVIGAIIIILGLYAILWAKEYEKKTRMLEPPICDQPIEIKSEK